MVLVFEENLRGNGKEEQQSAIGRQVNTLNLTITLRVMLVGIFLNPFSPSIYIYTYYL